MMGADFAIGDRVEKVTGEYKFPGEVVAVFTKRNRQLIRYVVENDDGILHIFSSGNLLKVSP